MLLVGSRRDFCPTSVTHDGNSLSSSSDLLQRKRFAPLCKTFINNQRKLFFSSCLVQHQTLTWKSHTYTHAVHKHLTSELWKGGKSCSSKGWVSSLKCFTETWTRTWCRFHVSMDDSSSWDASWVREKNILTASQHRQSDIADISLERRKNAS